MNLETILIVLLILLWAGGYFGAHIAMGGLIHLLLVVAVIVLIVKLVRSAG